MFPFPLSPAAVRFATSEVERGVSMVISTLKGRESRSTIYVRDVKKLAEGGVASPSRILVWHFANRSSNLMWKTVQA
jgi:hypothetical protein